MAFGPLRVLVCLPDPHAQPPAAIVSDRAGQILSDPTVFTPLLHALAAEDIHFVGSRPKKPVDELLTDNLVVLGSDADLNAIVLRLLRKNRIATTRLTYLTPEPTPITALWQIPTGAEAAGVMLQAARRQQPAAVPLARSDAGGVLVGRGTISPMVGNIYVDENRVLAGTAKEIAVTPHPAKGLAVSITQPKFFGLTTTTTTTLGRATELGLIGNDIAIVSDGIRHPRPMKRWVYYQHTEPLQIIRP